MFYCVDKTEVLSGAEPYVTGSRKWMNEAAVDM